MSPAIDAPLEGVEFVGSLRLPLRTDKRLQELMDRYNEGLLTDTERVDLESCVELSERLSLVRAEAIHLLGRKPESPAVASRAEWLNCIICKPEIE